jgi:hypothetical protein
MLIAAAAYGAAHPRSLPADRRKAIQLPARGRRGQKLTDPRAGIARCG